MLLAIVALMVVSMLALIVVVLMAVLMMVAICHETQPYAIRHAQFHVSHMPSAHSDVHNTYVRCISARLLVVVSLHRRLRARLLGRLLLPLAIRSRSVRAACLECHPPAVTPRRCRAHHRWSRSPVGHRLLPGLRLLPPRPPGRPKLHQCRGAGARVRVASTT